MVDSWTLSLSHSCSFDCMSMNSCCTFIRQVAYPLLTYWGSTWLISMSASLIRNLLRAVWCSLLMLPSSKCHSVSNTMRGLRATLAAIAKGMFLIIVFYDHRTCFLFCSALLFGFQITPCCVRCSIDKHLGDCFFTRKLVVSVEKEEMVSPFCKWETESLNDKTNLYEVTQETWGRAKELILFLQVPTHCPWPKDQIHCPFSESLTNSFTLPHWSWLMPSSTVCTPNHWFMQNVKPLYLPVPWNRNIISSALWILVAPWLFQTPLKSSDFSPAPEA